MVVLRVLQEEFFLVKVHLIISIQSLAARRSYLAASQVIDTIAWTQVADLIERRLILMPSVEFEFI